MISVLCLDTKNQKSRLPKNFAKNLPLRLKNLIQPQAAIFGMPIEPLLIPKCLITINLFMKF
jgi:hypothetical protein